MTPPNDCPDINLRIKKICSSKGMSIYKLAKCSGVPYSALSSMFKRGTQPSLNTLYKLCNGLNMSLSDFFATGDIAPIPLDDKAKELVALFNRLPHEKQELLMAYLRGLCDSELAFMLE